MHPYQPPLRNYSLDLDTPALLSMRPVAPVGLRVSRSDIDLVSVTDRARPTTSNSDRIIPDDTKTALHPPASVPMHSPDGPNGVSSMYTSLLQSQKMRVILLEPGTGTEPLRCHLLHVSSFSQIPYKALSYQWGDIADKSCSLICCGTIARISATLDAALRRLRSAASTSAVWVDAICINQDDLAERADQVRVMKDIYANAVQVVVWLGSEKSGDASAVDELNRIDQDRRQPAKWTNGFGSFYAPVRGSGGLLSIAEFYTTAPKLRDVKYEHIVQLLCRGYFHRAWIVQELVMSDNITVLYGDNKHVSWDVLANVVRRKMDRVIPQDILDSPMVQNTRRNVEFIERARLRRRRHQESSLFGILFDTAQTQCTDDRDKIFAFLGIAQDWLQDSDGLEPDYEVNVATLFKKVASWCLKASGGFHILSCSAGPWDRKKQDEILHLLQNHTSQAKNRRALLQLPSWVPDWTRIGSSTPLVLHNNHAPFAAASARPAEYTVEEDVLIAKGLAVSQIKDIVRSTPPFVKTTAFYSLRTDFIDDVVGVRDWIEECTRIASLDFQLIGDRFESFCSAMTCGLTEHAKPAPSNFPSLFGEYLDHIEEAPRMFRYILESAEQNKWNAPGIIMEKTAHRGFKGLEMIEASLERWSKGRRFFTTPGGLMGQAPERAKKGDHVCVLYGSEVPILIRPSAGGFEVVGECYVSGIMNGEVLQSPNGREQEFRFGPRRRIDMKTPKL